MKEEEKGRSDGDVTHALNALRCIDNQSYNDNRQEEDPAVYARKRNRYG